MKSIFVTLLSGFMIYAGYIYHPIIHRMGDQISHRFETEFVPVGQKSGPVARKTAVALSKKQASPNEEKVEQPVTNTEDAAEVSPQTNSNIEPVAPTPEKVEQISFPKRNVKPASTWSSQNRHIPKKRSPIHKPPKFDLYTALKRGLDLSVPSNYYISDRDRELGGEIQKLENDFDQKYANQHLTLTEIKQLKLDYQNAFNELADKYNLSSKQLTRFQEIIKRHNF